MMNKNNEQLSTTCQYSRLGRKHFIIHFKECLMLPNVLIIIKKQEKIIVVPETMTNVGLS